MLFDFLIIKVIYSHTIEHLEIKQKIHKLSSCYTSQSTFLIVFPVQLVLHYFNSSMFIILCFKIFNFILNIIENVFLFFFCKNRGLICLLNKSRFLYSGFTSQSILTSQITIQKNFCVISLCYSLQPYLTSQPWLFLSRAQSGALTPPTCRLSPAQHLSHSYLSQQYISTSAPLIGMTCSSLYLCQTSDSFTRTFRQLHSQLTLHSASPFIAICHGISPRALTLLLSEPLSFLIL